MTRRANSSARRTGSVTTRSPKISHIPVLDGIRQHAAPPRLPRGMDQLAQVPCETCLRDLVAGHRSVTTFSG